MPLWRFAAFSTTLSAFPCAFGIQPYTSMASHAPNDSKDSPPSAAETPGSAANAGTAAELSAAGIATRYLYSYELHAKLIIADGVPFVGSQNLSTNAIENNREVGVLVTDTEAAGIIATQFEADWAAGVTAP